MTSLLQFDGKVTEKGVHLEFVQVDIPEPRGPGALGEEGWRWPKYVDQFTCSACGGQHPYIWIVVRKPAGRFGAWVVFRYNGEEHVPDLSLSIPVVTIPRGARKLSEQESSEVWHR